MGKPSAQKMHDLHNSAQTDDSSPDSESGGEAGPSFDLVEVPITTTKR